MSSLLFSIFQIFISGQMLPPISENTGLKYHDSIPDAVADQGEPKSISDAFIGFQKFLYEQVA